MLLLSKLFIGELTKRGGFDIVENWWDHHPMSVMQNSFTKLLRDFTIQTDRHLSHNHPDILCVDFIKSHCFLIDVAIPGDSRLSNKVTKKLERYSNLKLEIQKMWSVRVSVVLVVIGSLGSIPTCLKKNLQLICIYYPCLIPKLQKNVLLSYCHMLRRFVTEH